MTFAAGTYHLTTPFTVGPGSCTFSAGTVVKYVVNSYIRVSGAIFTPPTGQLMPVLTQKDDNLFGETIAGSTGSPSATNGAAQAIVMYFPTSGTSIINMRIRYAQTAVYYQSPANNTPALDH